MTSGPSTRSQGAALFQRAARSFVTKYWPGEFLEAASGGEPAGSWSLRALRKTAHVARSLESFVQSATLVDQTRFLHHLMVLPVAGPVAAAMPTFEGMEFVVVGEQFVDLLKFHYQMSAGFRLAEYLAQTGAPVPEQTPHGRALVYWAGLEWIHDWFRHNGGTVPDLAPLIASPVSLVMDSDAILQALLFMVLHECGHFALGHVTDGPNNQGMAAFRQLSAVILTPEQEQELAADAWAVRAMHWPNPGWQCVAIARLFVLFGVAHAALGTRSPEHPYLHDRCAHLVAALQANGVEVPTDTLRLPAVIAQEYEHWQHKAGRISVPTRDENLAFVGSYLSAVSRQFESAGGDAAFLAWMQSRNVPVRPW